MKSLDFSIVIVSILSIVYGDLKLYKAKLW